MGLPCFLNSPGPDGSLFPQIPGRSLSLTESEKKNKTMTESRQQTI